VQNAASKADEIETEEAKKLVEKLTGSSLNDEESMREIVKNAARAVGSISDVEFDLTFNPDVFQDHVQYANAEVGYSINK
jgi:protein TIF31